MGLCADLHLRVVRRARMDYRTDGNMVHMRCMHCATDHEIDLVEGVAVPMLSE